MQQLTYIFMFIKIMPKHYRFHCFGYDVYWLAFVVHLVILYERENKATVQEVLVIIRDRYPLK